MHYILVVDDLVDNLFLLQTLLESEGYRVQTAESGEVALATINATPPDLVLLDVMMPGIDGYEVTRRIRQDSRLASVPILLITAHDATNATLGLSLGANAFVRKPLDFDELMQRMRSLLQEYPPSHKQPVSSHRTLR
ncbi:response regulator [Oculatella sp. LEGE 06141]